MNRYCVYMNIIYSHPINIPIPTAFYNILYTFTVAWSAAKFGD